MSRHPYSIEINEPEEREEQDPFDNSDEEMEDKREREEEDTQDEDLITRDRAIVAKLIRKEFDTMSKGIEGHDGKVELIRVARRRGYIEMAEEMTNDLKVGSI